MRQQGFDSLINDLSTGDISIIETSHFVSLVKLQIDASNLVVLNVDIWHLGDKSFLI